MNKKKGVRTPNTPTAIQADVVSDRVQAFKLQVSFGFWMNNCFLVMVKGCIKVITSALARVTENAAAANDESSL